MITTDCYLQKDEEMKRLMMEKQKECHQMLLAKDAEIKKLMR